MAQPPPMPYITRNGAKTVPRNGDALEPAPVTSNGHFSQPSSHRASTANMLPLGPSPPQRATAATSFTTSSPLFPQLMAQSLCRSSEMTTSPRTLAQYHHPALYPTNSLGAAPSSALAPDTQVQLQNKYPYSRSVYQDHYGTAHYGFTYSQHSQPESIAVQDRPIPTVEGREFPTDPHLDDILRDTAPSVDTPQHTEEESTLSGYKRSSNGSKAVRRRRRNKQQQEYRSDSEERAPSRKRRVVTVESSASPARTPRLTRSAAAGSKALSQPPVRIVSSPSPFSADNYIVPKKLEGSKQAMGEYVWNEYVALVQRFVEGKIEESSLLRRTRRLFLVGDEAAERKIKRWVTQMVVDGLSGATGYEGNSLEESQQASD